jgi:Domain of unknown function (DUF4272)
MTADILVRKKNLEERLARHGIKEPNISYLPYLEFDSTTFATPYETGCRMMILYSVAYSASELDDRGKITDWLKRENLWTYVSTNEKEFLEGNVPNEQKIIDFSWQGECAYILAWTLNLIKDTPTPTEQVSEELLSNFTNVVPQLGEKLEPFLSNLTYRDFAEIYDENLFHELATTYFRDLLFNEHKDTSNIERGVSFLRHQALNWLRRFMDISDWDETDTST